MKWLRSQVWRCVTWVLLAALAPLPASAQLAPTGGHYAGRASDTGHAMGGVSASGGYSASVPLDLPAARGGLPVPLQIVYGSRDVGAAGLGWDVPLSYLRRDTSFARRRPKMAPTAAPAPRERLFLSLLGQGMELVPSGQVWVAQYGTLQLTARQQNDTWVIYDGQGLTYLFTAPAHLPGAGLWLLKSVSGSGGATVQLEYALTTPLLPGGGQGAGIDLTRVLYNPHPTTGCAKHEVALVYGAASTSPLSLSVLGDRVLARMRTLSAVEVKSRATCGTAAVRLRRYELAYLPDADTMLPRLQSVRMLGRAGTAEQSTAVPIASYTYGTALNPGTGKLRYQKTQAIALPADVDSAMISGTVRDNTVAAPAAAGIRYATWQSLTDVTGDGRPELVFPKNGKLWVAHNRPGSAGTSTLGAGQAIAQLSDATFASGAFETRSATNNRFTYGADHRNVDHVWRQAIDINGDGRMDIIDAAEEPGHWVLYVNTPGTGASGVKWERRSYSVSNLAQHLSLRGHWLFDDYVPLSRRFTGRDRTVGACWIYDGTAWEPYPAGWSNGACGTIPNQLLSVGDEQTYVEWEVTDINGDGYVDVVFNSSPVDLVSQGGPSYPGSVNQTANTRLLYKVQPTQGDTNNVDAVLNVRGLAIDLGTSPFSAPVTVRSRTSCGVGLWAASTGGDTQYLICGQADVNGDGLADRIEQRRKAFLGTGAGFSLAQILLPGEPASQRSDQLRICQPSVSVPPPGTTPYGVSQSLGLRDLTGDGIPDWVESYGGTWRVSIGTGTGFAPPIDIEVVGSSFSFSSETETCDGTSSKTHSGLYDIDGDGKPEVVRVNGQSLDVYQLAGGAVPRTPEAGRLIEVNNGYGAKTRIGYRSAKEDGTTPHQVPFPELVVSSVDVMGTMGLGGSLSVTRYAYGGAEQFYDTAIDAFRMPAYQRTVELRLIGEHQDKTEGTATITDTYGLAPFMASPKNERFGRYLRAGRVRDVHVLHSVFDSEPWTLLAANLTTDSRRKGGTHYDWGIKLFEEPAVPGTTVLDCVELMYPYDFVASWGANPGFYDVCSAHGFVFPSATDSWRGDAAPPSTNNVATRSLALEVDDFGRVLKSRLEKDRSRGDDDVCVDIQYATPTSTGPRVLSAPSSKQLGDCSELILSSESWAYDNLAAGSVAQGWVTSHTVERRAADNGILLRTVRAFDATYDVAGNPTKLVTKREDGASRTVSFSYDPFGLASVGAMVSATGTPSLTATLSRDAVSLDTLSTTGPNQEESGVELDGFGRVVRSTVKPLAGTSGVLSTTSYLGFNGTDPLGRRIVTKSFSDPVTPGSEGGAPGQTSTVYLDELGRERRTEVPLGADYAQQTLIVGARTYDVIGRIAFEADPYLSSQDAATAYGTTYHFKADGTPACFIRGNGAQPLSSVTDGLLERYPTCYYRSFSQNRETLGVSDAAALLPNSAQAGVVRQATLTAAGRVLSRSTWKNGARLEHATFAHDRLGNLTGMTRFLDPVGATNPVQWSWRFDSAGQVLQWQEPESVAQYLKYSDWGELLEVYWADTTRSPVVERRVLSQYDALGRLSHREERNNGVIDPETVHDYVYDFGSSVTPEVTPRNMLGRLAQTQSLQGDVFYSYDDFGRIEARTFTNDLGDIYVEKTTHHADGTLAVLQFYLPDASYKEERVDYGYDSAARVRSIKYADGSGIRELYAAEDIDPLGRVRMAWYGGNILYQADYTDIGRNLMREAAVTAQSGSRSILYLGYDPLGRELSRREIKDGASGPRTNVSYDALGRLSTALQTDGATTLSNRQFSYDALGNALSLVDAIGSSDAALSYRTVDRDRICRIGYGNGGLGGTTCNVVHDGVGNIVGQTTRTGYRQLSYFATGGVRTITEGAVQAHFRYDALGDVQELELQGGGADARYERRYGGLIERRDQVLDGSPTTLISRKVPGPGGIVATRRGDKAWFFLFGEERGNRFFADGDGNLVQEVAYQPYGEATSSGALPGSLQYSGSQWNGGDTLAALGLSQLGARIYDPVIGRFLSRDPLRVLRTAATTHPYAFAMNDPLNLSDPSGLDPGCLGQECQGSAGTGFPGGGGGPSGINPPGLYLPSAPAPAAARPQPMFQPPAPTQFKPKGPQTNEGRFLKMWAEMYAEVDAGDDFDFDRLARMKVPLKSVIERLKMTPAADAAVDAYNAKLDRWSSFSAGFGDAVWFWCPGCGANARQAWGITSGDADSWAYTWGSITGSMGLFAAPTPTSIIAPPKANVAAEVQAMARDVNPHGIWARNCANCSIATDATLAGNPASALRGTATEGQVLATHFNRAWTSELSSRQLSRTVQGWGPGSRGIVFGSRGPLPGHFFNVVNKNGQVIFVDGQRWGVPSGEKYKGYFLLRTD